MSGSHTNTFPKIHNAMWPGLVGKGSPGAEPTIDLDTMLNLTAAAQVDGIKFDGVDLFLYDPHINIDISDEALEGRRRQDRRQGVRRSARWWRQSGSTPRRWATTASAKTS